MRPRSRREPAPAPRRRRTRRRRAPRPALRGLCETPGRSSLGILHRPGNGRRQGYNPRRGPLPRFVMRLRPGVALIVGLSLATAMHEAAAQHGAPNGEWKTYGGDLGNTRYSPLDQVNATNFSKLEVAWRFKTDSLGPTREYTFESTPLMVDGVVYSTAGSRRAVVALDARTGELLWVHRLGEGERRKNAPRPLSRRGPPDRKS